MSSPIGHVESNRFLPIRHWEGEANREANKLKQFKATGSPFTDRKHVFMIHFDIHRTCPFIVSSSLHPVISYLKINVLRSDFLSFSQCHVSLRVIFFFFFVKVIKFMLVLPLSTDFSYVLFMIIYAHKLNNFSLSLLFSLFGSPFRLGWLETKLILFYGLLSN